MTLLWLSSILFFTCSVFGQDPIVLIQESEPPSIGNGILMEAERDRDVTMDCYVENLPEDTKVRWQKTTIGKDGRASTQKISEDAAIEDNTKHSIEKPTQFTWRLRIKAIQVSDEANYTCYVQVTIQNKVTANRTVHVLVAPTLNLGQTSPDVTVDEDANEELRCNASGRPTPSIEWTRLGGALLPIGKEKHQGAILSLEDIKAEDRGKYRCVVQNRMGKVTRDITLSVRFKPIITTVSKVVRQKRGCQIELQCLASANPYPQEEGKSWIMGATAYSLSTGRFEIRSIQGAFNQLTYEMIISNLQPDDYGIYQCRIKNSLGSSTSTILLEESEEAQPSVKFGRTICGGAEEVIVSQLLISLSVLATLLFSQKPHF